MNEINEGEMAWDILDSKTRKLLKEEIMSIYDSGEEDISIDDIYRKLDEKIPVDIITIAVGELIDEGKVIEEEINPGEILSIVRQNKTTLTRMERKLDVVAQGVSKVIKLLSEIKSIVNDDYGIDIDIKEYITSVSGIVPNKEEKKYDSEKRTIETEDSSDSSD